MAGRTDEGVLGRGSESVLWETKCGLELGEQLWGSGRSYRVGP